ncbi:mechanosensitive ion channel family protein [Loktanella sp. S4079]|uniref:mechanosensitive ion channel family protein n=1 Tax=Loktanella sp. S4079 TaxID=579483 RepID=UPI0005FA2B0E|nr:mechanosensitive ion channel domain-containing protein [Loktanella sp. S4079]KJZ19298.1 mechanosensitive ion channel protein MscS [Loktanella sp. S4079]
MFEGNDLVEQAKAAFDKGLVLAQDWLLSPAAWSQFGLLIAAYLLARIVNAKLTPRIEKFLTPEAENKSILSQARRFVLQFLPLILPLLAYGFTAIGEAVTRSIFGSGAVIAFGKRVFLFLAARALAKDIIKDPFLRMLAKFVLVPATALYALGFFDQVIETLGNTAVNLGNISFSALAIIRGLIAGSLLFWLGQWSNSQSAAYIEQQPMRPAIRQLAVKATEFTIFGIAFLLLMNIMGISLSSLAIIGGAVGVGLGFGLQKIASNFISGVILLVEGQATVGDYVELDGGEAGTIIKMTARATFLETFDGRWIVVPNEDFITTRVVNYSDSGSANRYEVEFSVSYDTDINKIPDIIEAAVAKHPEVLTDPEAPDCELRGFGDSGIDFAVEFWVNGIDDGKNKYTSDVLFLVWNALKDNGIEIPYPHRVVEIKGNVPS